LASVLPVNVAGVFWIDGRIRPWTNSIAAVGWMSQWGACSDPLSLALIDIPGLSSFCLRISNWRVNSSAKWYDRRCRINNSPTKVFDDESGLPGGIMPNMSKFFGQHPEAKLTPSWCL
jgi:hypothetical protein